MYCNLNRGNLWLTCYPWSISTNQPGQSFYRNLSISHIHCYCQSTTCWWHQRGMYVLRNHLGSPQCWHKPLFIILQREHGWRTAKRPGVDYFIAYLSQFFEIVVFTSQHQYVSKDVALRQQDAWLTRHFLKDRSTDHWETWPVYHCYCMATIPRGNPLCRRKSSQGESSI